MGGAFAYGIGSVLQSVGARRAAAAGHGLLGVARQWPYLAGLGCDLAGWLLSLLALRDLPLFAVQAILAGSLAVTVVIAAAMLGVAHSRADTTAIALILVALVALAASAGSEDPRSVGTALEWGLVAGVPAVAIAAAVAAARWSSPVATGAAAGLAFAGAALCARALPDPGSVAGFVTEPLAVALAAYGVVGMLAYAHALENGQVGPVTAALWVTEIIVPAIAGIALLGDRARPGWAPVVMVASTMAVAATVVLALSPAQSAGAAGEECHGPAA
ncbi:MAG: hypothetical protein QOJ23_5811 [Actinomycetota bacterium]|nr:hypothetical protein [Actinomycetota bacterium]